MYTHTYAHAHTHTMHTDFLDKSNRAILFVTKSLKYKDDVK